MLDDQPSTIAQATSPSTSNQTLHQIFEQFLSLQVMNIIASKVKSEHTANLKIFSDDGRNMEVTHEKLENFIISLQLKITLNTN